MTPRQFLAGCIVIFMATTIATAAIITVKAIEVERGASIPAQIGAQS